MKPNPSSQNQLRWRKERTIQNPIQLRNAKALSVKNSISRSAPHKVAGLLVLLVLTSFAFVLNTKAADGNTANGSGALYNVTTGTGNTATGSFALGSNTSGNKNTADGLEALGNNTGSLNVAVGYAALISLQTGNSNIAVGATAGINLIQGSSNIDIGSSGVQGDSNTIRIGQFQTRAFVAGVYGAGVSGRPVTVNSDGQLGTAASSARFKDEIKPMDKTSEAILALKPVTFRYKKEIDSSRIPQFGLVAEDVAKVNPDLVVRDEKGEIYSVRYEAVNAMLLNEFLKEHKKVEEQEATITQLKKEMETVVARLKEQDSRIQKVSDQLATASPSRGGLELMGPAAQKVVNR